MEYVSEFKYLLDVFLMNQVHMRQSVVGKGRIGGGLQALLGL